MVEPPLSLFYSLNKFEFGFIIGRRRRSLAYLGSLKILLQF